MSVLDRIRMAVTGGSPRRVLYECRRCGTSLDPGQESCPECESDEIVRFVV